MDTILSIVMLTAVALTLGAAYLWRKHGLSRQPLLMVVLAAIMVANILIWTL